MIMWLNSDSLRESICHKSGFDIILYSNSSIQAQKGYVQSDRTRKFAINFVCNGSGWTPFREASCDHRYQGSHKKLLTPRKGLSLSDPTLRENDHRRRFSLIDSVVHSAKPLLKATVNGGCGERSQEVSPGHYF